MTEETPTVKIENSIELTYIMEGGQKYGFIKPLSLQINFEVNMWSCYNDELGLCGFGRTREEAIEDARTCLANRCFDKNRQTVIKRLFG